MVRKEAERGDRSGEDEPRGTSGTHLMILRRMGTKQGGGGPDRHRLVAWRIQTRLDKATTGVSLSLLFTPFFCFHPLWRGSCNDRLCTIA